MSKIIFPEMKNPKSDFRDQISGSKFTLEIKDQTPEINDQEPFPDRAERHGVQSERQSDLPQWHHAERGRLDDVSERNDGYGTKLITNR